MTENTVIEGEGDKCDEGDTQTRRGDSRCDEARAGEERSLADLRDEMPWKMRLRV